MSRMRQVLTDYKVICSWEDSGRIINKFISKRILVELSINIRTFFLDNFQFLNTKLDKCKWFSEIKNCKIIRVNTHVSVTI